MFVMFRHVCPFVSKALRIMGFSEKHSEQKPISVHEEVNYLLVFRTLVPAI
jgi:hypothetical protein